MLVGGQLQVREGGGHGLAQAEAEYKDFILFYPTMEESAEAQNRVCDIHFKQMEKPDRDSMHAKAVSAPVDGEGVTSATMSTASSWAASR